MFRTIVFTSFLCQTLASPAVIHLKTTHESSEEFLAKRQLYNRAVDLNRPLQNAELLILTNITVGNPPQPQSIQLDTGSSDLWVPVTGSRLCQQPQALCEDLKSYDPQQSTSALAFEQSPQFEIAYMDGTKIQGDYLIDSVGIEDISLDNVTFAAASTGQSSLPIVGILGIGFSTDSSAANAGLPPTDLVSHMVSQGYIKSKAYSFWLDGRDADPLYITGQKAPSPTTGGNLLFGGIDTAKYRAPLVSMPIFPDPARRRNQLAVPMTGVAFSSGGQSYTFSSSSFNARVLLDSGSSGWHLPTDMVAAIYKVLGAEKTSETYYVPCNLGDSSSRFSLTFNGNVQIDVPLTDIIRRKAIKKDDGTVLQTSNGQDACGLHLAANDEKLILGIPFFRAAYITFDLQNSAIALAQADPSASSVSIKEIDGSIPADTTMTSLSASSVDQTVNTANPPTFSLPVGDTRPAAGIPSSSSNPGSSSNPSANGKPNSAASISGLCGWTFISMIAAMILM